MAKPLFDPSLLPAFMTVDEAADMMQISEEQVRKMLRAGKLKGKRPGRAWLIPSENIVRYMGLPMPGGVNTDNADDVKKLADVLIDRMIERGIAFMPAMQSEKHILHPSAMRRGGEPI